MILPLYGGVPSIKKRPVSWGLFLINIAVFLIFYNMQLLTGYELNDRFDQDFLVAQGKMFSQLINNYPKYYTDIHRELSRSAMGGDKKKSLLLGQLALGDEHFLSLAENYIFKGDEVEIKYWRVNYQQVLQLRNEHPNFQFGLSSSSYHWYNWVSYMFIHAGFSHLIGNMWFLLVVGAVVERMIGSMAFFLFYIFSGVCAAILYFEMAGVSAIPLVGASGAISSLLAFYSVTNWRRKLRYLSVLFFFRKDLAVVSLPAWTGFLYWLLADLAGFFSQLDQVGGVAHAAHIGGALIGVLFGLLFRWRKSLSHGILSNNLGV